MEKTVSVIVPTRNRIQKLERCLRSVLEGTYPQLEVVVVDDCSDEDPTPFLRSNFPSVKVYRNESRKLLSESRNLGAFASQGELLFFLDDDNVVAPDAIESLVRAIEGSSTLAVVCPVIFYLGRPSRIWTTSITKGRVPGSYVLGTKPLAGPAETFSFHDAFMVRRSAFERVGGFDSHAFPIHFSELDFAYRVHGLGYDALVSPSAKVWHDVAVTHMHVDSTRSYYTLRNRIILMKRYVSRGEYASYVLLVLPLLTEYYFFHHLLGSTGNRLAAPRNLLRGVVDGLTYVEPPTRRSEGKPIGSAETPAPRNNPPLVSVIIPTRNSEATLARCLESLEEQTYPNLEIIVVDNHSSDHTVGVAQSFKGVRFAHAGPERSSQVNLGSRIASGDYLYRVDSDFVLDPKVIDEAVRKCSQEGFEVIAIHNTSDPNVSYWAGVRKLERDCYVDDNVNIAARFFSRTAFESVGGFDDSMVASEDFDLHNRLVKAGYKIGRILPVETHIGEPSTLSEVVRKNVFYGTTFASFLAQNPGALTRQLSPIRLSYVRHWRDFLRRPSLIPGFFVYEYVRWASAFFGYAGQIFSHPTGR
jgi:GT2 family glycosyltransferase